MWHIISCLVLLVITIAHAEQAQQDLRLYISGLQQRDLAIFDAASQQLLHSIPVQDGSGIIGVAVSSEGRTVFVVEGEQLRLLDAKSGETMSQHTYQNPLHLLGGKPIVHLTADDRVLLVKTYDLTAAAAGVRMFDVKAGAFTSTGLRSRSCGTPDFASASDGTLVAVCPGLIQAFTMMPAVSGDFSEVQRVTSPLSEVTGVALTADGKHLYMLDYLKPLVPWLLVSWSRFENEVQQFDLRQILTIAPKAEEQGRRAWLAVAPDGATLALLHSQRLWLVNSQSHQVVRQVELPDAAVGLTYTPDGRELIALDYSQPVLIRIPVSNGAPQRLPLPGLKPSRGPKMLLVAPAPR